MAIVQSIAAVVPGEDFRRAVLAFPETEYSWAPAGPGGDVVVGARAGSEYEVVLPDQFGDAALGETIPLSAVVEQFEHFPDPLRKQLIVEDTPEEIPGCDRAVVQEFQGTRKPHKLMSFDALEGLLNHVETLRFQH